MARQMMLARITLLGWTRTEFARRLGRDAGHVSRILSGERESAAFWRDAERIVSQAEARDKARG